VNRTRRKIFYVDRASRTYTANRIYEEQGISKFEVTYETMGTKFSSSRGLPKFRGRLSPFIPLVYLILLLEWNPTEGPKIIVWQKENQFQKYKGLISMDDEYNPKLCL
jgi:hypothetical protein